MRFQVKLSALLIALFYGAALSAVIVRFAGSNWTPAQTSAAYIVVMSITLGVFLAARGKLRISAYLLLAPLLFVAAVTGASLLEPRSLTAKPAPVGPFGTIGSRSSGPALAPSPISTGTR